MTRDLKCPCFWTRKYKGVSYSSYVAPLWSSVWLVAGLVCPPSGSLSVAAVALVGCFNGKEAEDKFSNETSTGSADELFRTATSAVSKVCKCVRRHVYFIAWSRCLLQPIICFFIALTVRALHPCEQLTPYWHNRLYLLHFDELIKWLETPGPRKREKQCNYYTFKVSFPRTVLLFC